jgi:acyl-CoA thioesterase
MHDGEKMSENMMAPKSHPATMGGRDAQYGRQVHGGTVASLSLEEALPPA